MLHTTPQRVFFFDRDGIVNQRILGGYVTTIDDFVLLEDFLPLLVCVKDAGLKAILITNQQGIAKGLMTESDLERIHHHMQECLQARIGTQFDDIFAATEADISSRLGCCGDRSPEIRRKPSPAMFLEAAKKWDIALHASWMIGDSLSDSEAGWAAGTRTMLVGEHFAPSQADIVVPHLRAALPILASIVHSVEKDRNEM